MPRKFPHQALVLGANGRLGKAILQNQEFFFWHKLVPVKEKLDNIDFLKKYKIKKGDFVINCAGYTDVKGSDENETEWKKCQDTNTILPHLLSVASEELGFKLILFSTDYSIRKEFQNNNYTISKQNMEKLCFQNALIIRVSNLIGLRDKKNTNIVSKLLNIKGKPTIGNIYIYPIILDTFTVFQLSQVIQSKGKGIINIFGPKYWLPNFTKKLLYMANKKYDLDVNFSDKIGIIETKHITIPLDWQEIKKCIR